MCVKRKISFVLFRAAVVCILSVVFLLSHFRCVQGAQTDMEEIVVSAAEILYNNEGSYNSVNANDNGAVSIGKLQWHGWRALSLLQTIAKANDEKTKELLGNTFYKEVTTTKDTSKWANRVLTNKEAADVKKLLAIQESKDAQDALAHKDITSYVEQGMRLGITNKPALVYFADLANQGGSGAAGRVGRSASNITGGYASVTLNELHEAAICDSVMGKSAYYSRRFGTYQYAAGLGWKYCDSKDSFIPYDYISACGDGAAWIQRALNTCTNAGLSVTGAYDNATKKAVKAFQSAKKMDADGQAGPGTIVALIKAVVKGETVSTDTPGSDTPSQEPDEPGQNPADPSQEPDEPGQNPAKPPEEEPDNSGSQTTLKKTTLSVEKKSYTFNDTFKSFTISASSNQEESPIEFESSDTSVLAVTADGNVTVNGKGSAKIVVSQAATQNYKAAKLNVSVTVYSTNPSDYPVPVGSLYAGKIMQTEYVQWLQASLISLGQKEMTVNGKWSDTLTKRVTDFQKKCGLEADGIVGDATYAVMKNMLAVKAAKPSLSAKKNTISWGKQSGANRIYVYRKEKGGAYSKIKTVKNMAKTSYCDQGIEKGKTYYYTVKSGCVQNKVKVESPRSKSVKYVCK